MKDQFDQKLFWFAPKESRWDVSNPGMVRTVVQQVLTHGRMKDVEQLLKRIPRQEFRRVFEALKRFLPTPVSSFWEVYFVHHQ